MSKIFAQLGAGLSAIVLMAILLFLLFFSWPLLGGHVMTALFSTQWDPAHGRYGLAAMMAGTLAVALLASAIAALFSLSIASYIDALPHGRMRRLLYRIVQLFGAIPTVVYGLMGVLLVVPFVRTLWTDGTGMSVAAAGGVLGLVITPTMALFLVDSFRATPPEHAAVTAALGGRTIQYQLYVLFAYHRRSMGVAFSLGLARALGDTMIALMMAGNSIQIPHALGDAVRTLTAHIALQFAGDFASMAFRSIFASGLVLFGMTVVLLGIVHYVRDDNHARR